MPRPDQKKLPTGRFPLHWRGTGLMAAAAAAVLLPAAVVAHSPSVNSEEAPSPAEAVVLEDATLSRAVGAVLASPGEVDWYRMDLEAGEPLVVGMTAPDAVGAVAATFTVLGPGLPAASLGGTRAKELADAADVGGAVSFVPAADPPREVHAGLGFINYGTVRLDAPETASYWIAVEAVDPDATGKYVLAPGVREEFGIDAIAGMMDLVGFFGAPWPPTDTNGASTD